MFKNKLSFVVVLAVGLALVAGGGMALKARAALLAEREALAQALLAAADDANVSVKSLPPVVVKTVPESGDMKVDAGSIKEIRVTFSKDMTDESWSWSSLSKDTIIKGTGKPSYDNDKRTCVLPVKLERGKTYAVWINSEKFTNFRDSDGKSAVPYLLVFETKP